MFQNKQKPFKPHQKQKDSIQFSFSGKFRSSHLSSSLLSSLWYGLVYFFSLSNFVLVFLLWYQKPLLLLPYKFLVLFKTRDGKWCIASGYAIRFRPICVCQIGIVKCSLDCILVRQDSSNRHREGVMDCPFLFSFFVDL